MSRNVHEELPRIKDAIEALGKKHILVGILGEADSEIKMIAQVHEYGCTITVSPKMRAYLHYTGLHLKQTTGTVNIPERSFIRASFESKQPEIRAIINAAVFKMFAREISADEAAERIGAQLAQLVQNFIRDGEVRPPISQYTKEHRTSTTDTPLFDTGTHIVDHITYAIEEV